MRLAELLPILALAGCMKIYQDTDLPDVTVAWDEMSSCFDFDPTAMTMVHIDATIDVSITSMDSSIDPIVAHAACDDLEVVLPDVPRERLRVASSRHRAGSPLVSTGYDQDLDLRNGFDTRVETFFRGFGNVQVAWSYAGGATCESLQYPLVYLDATDDDGLVSSILVESCFQTSGVGHADPGSYTFQLRAATGDPRVVATSATTTATVDESRVYDLGTLELVPCGASCPPIPGF